MRASVPTLIMKHKWFVVVLLSISFVYAVIAANPPNKAASQKAAPPKKGSAAPAKAAADSEAKPKAPAAEAAAIPDTVAVVEGQEIKKAELDAALTQVLAQTGRSPTDIPAEHKANAYRMILDDMIADKLITKRAAEVQVSDEDVDATFKRVTANMGSDQEVRLQIEQSGQTIPKVKENIRASLRQQHWIDAQLKGRVEVSDGDAEAFFKKNPEQFKTPERVRASHILLSMKPEATPDVVAKRQKEAAAIVERVRKGEDFSKLAAELSEDPSAKQNNGDLNFFAKEQMVPEFSEAAFKMEKDQVSDPVRSQFGLHVIKVTDRKPPGAMSLEEAKPRLVAFLKQQKKQAEVEKLVREIREKADIKVNLPPAAPAEAAAPGAPAAPAAEPAPTEKRP